MLSTAALSGFHVSSIGRWRRGAVGGGGAGGWRGAGLSTASIFVPSSSVDRRRRRLRFPHRLDTVFFCFLERDRRLNERNQERNRKKNTLGLSKINNQ